MSSVKDEFSKQLVCVAKELGVSFNLNGELLELEKAFSAKGMLPAFLRRADQLCNFCMGYGLGVSFTAAAGSMTGSTVDIDDKVPTSVRLLCVTDVLVELMQNSRDGRSVALDELLLDGY